MSKKCIGCGAVLQDNNVLLEGFTTNLTNDYCIRCFRMNNYGDYQLVTKSNEEFIDILKNIGKKKNLVLYVVDVLNIPKDLGKIKDYLVNNDIMLVLNKRDILPLSIIDDKVINYFKEQNLGFIDIILISALKDYNLDLLYSKIKKYNNKEDVYVVGNTNAGKSMLINKFMKNYMAKDEVLSISPMPSTTLNQIKLSMGSFNIIDTPGLVDNSSIINHVDVNVLKKLSCRKEIKPRVFQIKKGQSLIVDNLLRIDYVEGDKNSFVFFVSNDLKIKKINTVRNKALINLYKREYNVNYREDIVINGLGFIKINDGCKLNIYLNKETDVFGRRNLI